MKYFKIISFVLVIIYSGCKTDQDVTVAMSGIVNFTNGAVFIKKSDGASLKAMAGSVVKEGDSIETATDKSIADIYIGENAVRLMGNSILKLSKMSITVKFQKEEVSMYLEKGSVFNKIVKKLSKDEKYEVKTPTAVASVRGTEFLLKQLNGSTNVTCLQGKVAVQDTEGKNVVLAEKEEVNVTPGQSLVKKQISDDAARKLKLLTDIKNIQDDIKQKYQKQKEEIRKKFEEERDKIKQAVKDQKEKNKEKIAGQKKKDQENIREVKDKTGQAAKESTDEAKKSMQESKNTVKDQKDSIKPDMDVKPKIDKNQFKEKK